MVDLSPAEPALMLHPDPHPAASSAALVGVLTRRRFLGEYADPERADAAARSFVERVLPRARLLRIGAGDRGARAGLVWLVEDGEDLAVLSLTLVDHSRAPEVRELLVALAAAEGFRRLTLGVARGDLALEQFVLGCHVEVAAFQMRLDLDHPPPAEDDVVLVPMGQATYDVYRERGIEEYAEVREKSGETRGQAQEIARQQLAALLPEGRASRHHHFFCGEVDGERVGTLWLGTQRPMTFVYDVVVDEGRRRQGHGAAIMRAAALWARARDAHALGLNVFGYNHGAKELYDRLGYRVEETFVALPLEKRDQDGPVR